MVVSIGGLQFAHLLFEYVVGSGRLLLQQLELQLWRWDLLLVSQLIEAVLGLNLQLIDMLVVPSHHVVIVIVVVLLHATHPIHAIHAVHAIHPVHAIHAVHTIHSIHAFHAIHAIVMPML